MKRLFLVAAILLLTACTAAHETAYVDAEFGQATQMSFDQQVAFPDNPHDGKIPENLEGISAEELMNAYTSSFSKSHECSKGFSINLFED